MIGDAIERCLIVGNEDNFRNEIRAAGGSVPYNQIRARFIINFSFLKKSDLILDDGNAVEIQAD